MELSMKVGSVWGVSPRDAAGARLTLEPDEALALSPKPRGLRVVCGQAWVTWRGIDYVLRSGERLVFSGGGCVPVLSTAGKGRVTVEMLG